MLGTRKVDRLITRKDTQGAFRKPTCIIRNRYALEESDSRFVVLFIVQ